MTPPDSISNKPPRAAWWSIALAVFLTGYFVYFNWGGLRVHFALDDLGNIGHYFTNYTPWQLVLSNLLPWRGDSRPLGGLFYIPIYTFAGLNPAPYQAVLLLLLLGNVYWAYRLARALGADALAAALVALVCCYHAGLQNLYYNAAFVFDVLCCFFYLASFVYYLGIRNRGLVPGPGQTVVFLGLFLCALNSKEMAVSIPLMLLVYECVYHPPQWNRVSLAAWLRGPARVALIAAALDLVDIYGKVAGPGAMIQAETYRPVFTADRILAFQRLSLQQLFFSWTWTPGWGQILALWAVLVCLAWRPGARPVLRFLFWYLVIVPLPIEFLLGKSQACLVLLLVGGAAFVAVVFVDAVETGTRFLWRGFRLPPTSRRIVVGILVAAAAFWWAREHRHLQQTLVLDQMASQGSETWDLIQQLQASTFHPHPGTSVAFLDDPFHTLDMYFLAHLWFHDRSVAVHVLSQGALTPQELAATDYIFTFEGRKLIRVK